jgi:hypothetical protein
MKQDQPAKPREWKFRVVVTKNGPHTIWEGESLEDLNMSPGNFHVVEYSAFEQQARMIEKLEAALVTIETGLVTTLETAIYAGFTPKTIAELVLAELAEMRGGK